MFDSHCHLDFDPILSELDRHLDEARASGVRGWLVPGTRPEQWAKLEAVSRPDVWLGVGLHPWETAEEWELDTLCSNLRDRALEFGVVALGELGLDKGRGGPLERQVEIFEAQLRLAGEMDLPVVLHQVGYQREFLRSLDRVGLPEAGGVVHGFGGDVSFGRALVTRGLLLGVGVGVTYESRRKLRGAVGDLPLDVFLLETDAPDQAPTGVDQAGTPRDLARVCAEVASLKGLAPEEVAEATESRARSFYGLPGG